MNLSGLFIKVTFSVLSALGFPDVITIEDRSPLKLYSYRNQVGSAGWFEWLEKRSTNLFSIHEKGPYDYEEVCQARKDTSGNWYLVAEVMGQAYQVHIGSSREMAPENIIKAVDQLYALPRQKK